MFHAIRQRGLWFGLAAAFVACGSDGDADPDANATQSCLIRNIGNIAGTDACTDYVRWSSATVLEACSVPGAIYSVEACATSKRIGGCKGNGQAGGFYIRWYYPRTDASTTATAADVMEDCKSKQPNETFVAP
jgi:hypothetical protein